MESGYSKADKANLPKVDSYMVANFFASNPDFCSAEFRNAKVSLSSRQSYGDDAIGYVQLKREANLCIVKCKICPEHKVRQQPYTVILVVDERKGEVISVNCNDCPASQGCCKHAVAFLMWSHRRSEEPSCTATECYWKKSKLAKVGSTLKLIKIKDMGNNSNVTTKREKNALSDFLEQGKKRKLQNCQILKHEPQDEDDLINLLSLHHLSSIFDSVNDCDDFISKIHPVFTQQNIQYVEKLTREQHKSPAWYELRYGRVTASKAFDVTRCKTIDGSLIATLMGAKIPDTIAMKRGRVLEKSVRQQLEKQHGNINQCGLFISEEYPMIAGSPDGILNGDTVIEIKCPINEDTYKKYFVSNSQVIAPRYYAQVQLQMHITKLKKCLFCVASWDFETNNKITVVPLKYSDKYVNDLLPKLIMFWKTQVYPLLRNSTK